MSAKAIAVDGAQRKCRDCGELFAAGPFARYCPVCRPLHRESKRTKYVLSGPTIDLLKERYDSTVRNRAAEIARQLGWPTWAVKKAARKLGLSTPAPKDRRGWTACEVATLNQWAGLRSAQWMGKLLGRGETSVVLKMKRMQLSRRVTDGYSGRDVATCFGVDVHVVMRWVARGWIRATQAGGGSSEAWTRFTEAELKRFVRQHPMEFDLKKVDQVWFVGLLLGSPLLDEEKSPVETRETREAG